MSIVCKRLAGALVAASVLGLALAGAATAQGSPDGAELYGLCVQCHGEAGEGSQLALAPAIAGLQEWYVSAQVSKFKSGLRGKHPDDDAGLRMYPMALALRSDAEIEAVSAYVASLPAAHPEPVLEGGDATRGQSLYAPCMACHGPDATGNEALLAPPLRSASDWYLLSSLERYKSGVRGFNPDNTQAQIMRGLVTTLADEQAMKDVIAYIMTLGNQAEN